MRSPAAHTIHDGETITWPIGMTQSESLNHVTQWKWAVLWTPAKLSAVPDIDRFYSADYDHSGPPGDHG
jgi:hypothetical protein